MDVLHHRHHKWLTLHPRNMRRVYPAEQVRQMAESIRERGILQPLVVVAITDPLPETPPAYYVVAGNLRLAALRTLGDAAPVVPVLVRQRSEADQLLDMAVENAVRFDPDPISEGQHYQRILLQPDMQMDIAKLARLTGISTNRIRLRLAWIALEEPIQDLVAHEMLPLGAATPLLTLPAGPVRVQAAKRFAMGHTSVRSIKGACTRISNTLQDRAEEERAGQDPAGPALGFIGTRDTPGAHATISPQALRQSLAEACAACPATERMNGHNLAWTILAHGAADSCASCNLRDLTALCRDCPLVIALRYVAKELKNTDR